MTKGADNDNVLSSVVAQSQDNDSWPTYGPGSTALAADPKAPSASSEIEQEPPSGAEPEQEPSAHQETDDEDFAGIDLSAQQDPEIGQASDPSGEVATESTTPVEAREEGRSLVVAGAYAYGSHFGISDAVPLAALGLAPGQRPTTSNALQVFIDLKKQEAERSRSQHKVGSANPHLFNTQPDLKAGVEAGARAAFAAVPPSSGPLTAQPGFLAGLIAAAVIGAGLYAYLV